MKVSHPSSTHARLLSAAALALLGGACGSGSTSSRGAANEHPDSFVLNEWAITAPTTPLHPGMVRVNVINIGGETHELVIIKIGDAASLPTKADGSVDEEAIPEADKAGEIPDVVAGKSVTKTIALPAGTYVAMCNLVEQSGAASAMAGGSGAGNAHMATGSAMNHVHFGLGMRTTFTVS